jgi:hypothetical protein
MNFDKLDTKYATGNLEADTQFIRDNLSIDDELFFKQALANIMSEGTARINSLTNEELDKIEGMFE